WRRLTRFWNVRRRRGGSHPGAPVHRPSTGPSETASNEVLAACPFPDPPDFLTMLNGLGARPTPRPSEQLDFLVEVLGHHVPLLRPDLIQVLTDILDADDGRRCHPARSLGNEDAGKSAASGSVGLAG